jgi:hypothetical protein
LLRRFVALFLVIAGVIALSGCYRGNPAGPTVGLVGDSITVLADETWGSFDRGLVDAFYIDVRARSSQRIDQMQPGLDELLASRQGAPTNVVINLGTNDMMQNFSNWEQSFDVMWASVADRPCVVYVTVREVSDRPIGTEINAKIRQMEAAHPNVRVYDWNADVIALSDAYLADPETVAPPMFDPVHPTSAGTDAMTGGIRRALESCPAPASATTLAEVTNWTHSYEMNDAVTYVDDGGVTRIDEVTDRGAGGMPLRRDSGFYGGAFGQPPLPGPRFVSADPGFNGAASSDAEKVVDFADGAAWDLYATLSPNANPYDPAHQFPGGGYTPPYWVLNVGRLDRVLDSTLGSQGTGPTVGRIADGRIEVYTGGFDTPPMPHIYSTRTFTSGQTIATIVFVSPAPGKSFLEVIWRNADGTVGSERTMGTLDPFQYPEFFLGYVHAMQTGAVAIKVAVPTGTELATAKNWAATLIPPAGSQ